MTAYWYRVQSGLISYGEPEIQRVDVVRSTEKMLFRPSSWGDGVRREAIDTNWYKTFKTRREAVCRVEHMLSNRVRGARNAQESAIAEERSALIALAKWRKREKIGPTPGTVGGLST